MNEKKKADVIAALMKAEPKATAELCKHYEDIIAEHAKRKKLDDQRIHGLLISNAKAMGVSKTITRRIP